MQPNSGSQANQGVYMAVLKPGDTVLGMSLAEGGHLTHGASVNASGKLYNFISYGLDDNEVLNYDQVEKLAKEHKPKLIVAGASAYALHIDSSAWAASPVKTARCSWSTSPTTRAWSLAAPTRFRMRLRHLDHAQSLRGARRRHHDEGRAREDHQLGDLPRHPGRPADACHRRQGRGLQGSAAPEFKDYAQQVVKNAKVLADTLVKRGLRIVSGRTESHVMLVDLRAKGITGKEAEAVLGQAHITVNKNAIPNDPEKPFVTSGIRLGTPAMTTRGFTEAEAELTANLIADVLDNPRDEANIAAVRQGQRTDLAPAGLRPQVSACAVRPGNRAAGLKGTVPQGPSLCFGRTRGYWQNIGDEFSPLDDFHRTDRYNMLNSCHPAFRDHTCGVHFAATPKRRSSTAASRKKATPSGAAAVACPATSASPPMNGWSWRCPRSSSAMAAAATTIRPSCAPA